MSLRITGGDLRGRLVATPEGNATRPTASRVREAVFSMLGPLHGASVLDLCSGAGTLAFEALSRGAGSAVLVDDAEAAVECARRNAAAYGVEDRTTVLHVDAIRAVRRLLDENATFDVIFLDAPYSRAPSLAERLDALLPELLEPAGRVVLEGNRKQPPRLSLPLDRERAYRDVLVQIHDAPQASARTNALDGA
ncbi:MAG: RsmD family RNA methyltransferase [Solirubrobacteraceae bacterium]|nr:RsmD family RNA methyltransferase [Solirubrobacteraceae bacterium]